VPAWEPDAAWEPTPAGTGDVEGGGTTSVRFSVTHPWVFQLRSGLIMVTILCIGLVVQLTLVSQWIQRATQVSLFNQFRTELALGTAPLGASHPRVAIGAAIAEITIPSIGVKQVVVEGTTSAALAKGPGLLPSTVFPGGAGSSVIMGRAASYGGPFGRIDQLVPGSRITVVTQVGRAVFKVVGVRYAGQKIKEVAPGHARLALQSATGPKFAPTGVVTVYADKIGPALAAQRPAVEVVPPDQEPLGIDAAAVSGLLLWLMVLAVVLAGAIWTWHRRGHAQAWIVFTAPLALIWFLVGDQVLRMLPNLL
jgi:hypothetical protein